MLLSLLGASATLAAIGMPHCAAMCGPMCARSVPEIGLYEKRGLTRLTLLLLGRVFGYVVAGALVAGLMQTLTWSALHWVLLKPIWAAAQALILGWGLILLLTAREPSWIKRNLESNRSGVAFNGVKDWVLVKNAARKQKFVPIHLQTQVSGTDKVSCSDQSSQAKYFGLGALWTIMPCGLLYSALMIAALAPSVAIGALVMLTFGLISTAPLLFSAYGYNKLRSLNSGGLQRSDLGFRLSGLFICMASIWSLWSLWDAKHPLLC